MFFKDFVSVKRKKIKKGASQTYDTPSFFISDVLEGAIKPSSFLFWAGMYWGGRGILPSSMRWSTGLVNNL